MGESHLISRYIVLSLRARTVLRGLNDWAYLAVRAGHSNGGRALAAKVNIGVVGAGNVADFHYIPGIRLDPRVELVSVCDTRPELLRQRKIDWNVPLATNEWQDVVKNPNVDAVLIATPNFSHAEIAIAALAAGKHVFCEKPLGLNATQVRAMYEAAQRSGLVHMTAFTYRFVPSMRYLRHLVNNGSLGEPRHFRSQRFLDWPETSWGWRQYRDRAGAGDLFDMTIHRIDFAMDLMGPLRSVCGAVAQFVKRDQTIEGESCPPSDVDDWSCLIGEFASGAVGNWEGSTLTKGYHLNKVGHEWAEVNGSEGTAVYRLHEPNVILLGKSGEDLKPIMVPREFIVPAGSPRQPHLGDPTVVFRYDMMWEFVSAITEGREAVPSFRHGLMAQIVADAVLQSFEERRWIDLDLTVS